MQAPPGETGPTSNDQSRLGPANDAVRDRLHQQVEEIEQYEELVRASDPEAIHKMRVALRRLRSALATFRPLFDRDQTEPLRSEMQWIARELGAVRDLQVTHERFGAVLADEPPELVIGPVQVLLDSHMLQELHDAQDELDKAMASQRYRDLRAALRSLDRQPPWVDKADGAGDRFMRKRVRKDWKRLSRAVDAAAVSTPEQRTESLHEVRKAAKRARYAAETLEPRFGADAKRFAAAAEEVQGILGDHHDRFTELPKLRQLGVAAHAKGDSAFTFGRLHSHEAQDAERLAAHFDATWRRTSRKKLRRWLRQPQSS